MTNDLFRLFPVVLLGTVSLLSGPIGAAVVINEIHYAADLSGAEEFVELYNPGAAPVDLSSWSFTRGIAYSFPPGSILDAGKYLVVAGNPHALEAEPRAPVLGPFAGRLANEGEPLELRDRNGHVIDQVDYGNRFPWPVMRGEPPSSIELIHPALDNDLGGSWRRAGSGGGASGALVREQSTWRYLKGSREPSSPRTAWRELGFDDTAWLQGTTPIGYGEPDVTTALPDMKSRYSSVYLRKMFTLESADAIQRLSLDVRYDDGFNAWINGVHVASANVPTGELPHDGLAARTTEPSAFEEFPLPRPSLYLRAGENVLAVQLVNTSLERSSDAFIDGRLRSLPLAGGTPGARNSVFSESPPIHAGQARHSPKSPRSGEPVRLSLKATSAAGIAAVAAEYQLVEAGDYFGIEDERYSTSWRRVPMNDSGTGGDLEAGDGTYSALLPAAVQKHRRLVRYRFVAESASGGALAAPGADDPQPNFAYFVYDGVPPWTGAIEPGSQVASRRRAVTYGPRVLEAVPVYHLITKRSDAEAATWDSRYPGSDYPWPGTLVYDGTVYDHIRYRARGGVWRYSMGKNMWKFDFHRGHRFQARDDQGREYAKRWDKLNLSAVIQQGEKHRRGEQGLFESVGFRLFNLAGVAAPKTHFVHFRIIDEAAETGGTQYDGDFWGLYLAVEQMDGRFLDEHGLPDGNLYKMEGGGGELNNLGFRQPADGSDVSAFLTGLRRSSRDVTWWRDNFDLEGYYSFRAIVEGIHHYDIGDGKNYFFFHDRTGGRWSILPWDIDLTWADHMYGGGDDPFLYGVMSHPALELEYRNRVREIRDLLFNSEQVGALIDESAAVVNDPAGGPSIVDADRALWDYHPVMSDWSRVSLGKTQPGLFYRSSPSGDFEGMARMMKEYAEQRGRLLDRHARDPSIPRAPRLEYAGPAGFPAGALEFRVSPFSDPDGDHTFGAMKWRLADVTGPGTPPFLPTGPRRYEIEATWESETVKEFHGAISVPADAVTAGRNYRVRVRVMDDTGRWSHWSAPVEFRAGE